MKALSLWLCLLLVGNFIISCQALALGDTCTPPTEDANPCTVTNSECNVNECKCSSGFTEEGGACLISLGLECQDADECVSNSKCGADKKCTCAEGFTAKDGLCSKVLDTDCTQSNEDTVCSLANMECKDGKCACEAGYKGDVTCSKIIGSTCTGSDACSGDVNTICKEDKCACKEDYAEQNAVCTLTVIGKDCSDTLKCEIDNAVCDTETSKCKCDADFTMNVNKCDPKNAAAMAGFGAIVLSLSVLSACLMMF